MVDPYSQLHIAQMAGHYNHIGADAVRNDGDDQREGNDYQATLQAMICEIRVKGT